MILRRTAPVQVSGTGLLLCDAACRVLAAAVSVDDFARIKLAATEKARERFLSSSFTQHS
jgi:hypothetical protein